MSASGLLDPAIPPCPSRATKRLNRGVSPESERSGGGGESSGSNGSPKAGRGKDKGKDEVEGAPWPKWGQRLLAGRRDPGSEFKEIHAISSDRAFREDAQQCYMSAYRNRKKNRYMDVLPYEHTRVRLDQDFGNDGWSSSSDSLGDGLPCGDYINASLLRGVLNYRYIATQAPLVETIRDFWQMVWEQEMMTVVMLTRIIEAKKIKAIRYWPCQIGEVNVCGEFSLKLLSERLHPCEHICVRRLQLTLRRGNSIEKRNITHLHYTEWPDYGLPCSTEAIRVLVHITDALHRDQLGAKTNKKSQEESEASSRTPILVHCSAGIGRAGTFIAIHQAIKQVEAKIEEMKEASGSESQPSLDVLSIKEIVLSMREQRRGMVQTKDQYCFIYKVAEDALFNLLESANSDSSDENSKGNWTNEGKAVALFLEGCNLDDVNVEKPQLTIPNMPMEEYQNQVEMRLASAIAQQNHWKFTPLEEDEEDEIEEDEVELEEEDELEEDEDDRA